MDIEKLAGFIFEVEQGKIVAATFCSQKISVGDEVQIEASDSKRLGIDQGRVGRVIEISKPDTRGLTSNIIGVDFMDCGLPTAQLKIHELSTNLALRS